MENETLNFKIHLLEEAICWLSNEVATNSCRIGKLTGDLDLSDFKNNEKSYKNKLDLIIGEE